MLRRTIFYSLILIICGCFPDSYAISQTIGKRCRTILSTLSQAEAPERISLLNELAIYRLIDNAGISLAYSEQAVHLADSLHDLNALADSYITQARGLFIIGKADSCRKCLEKALALKNRTGDQKGKETIYQFFGRLSNSKGDVQQALLFYDTALVYAETNLDYLRQGRICNEIAECYRFLNDNNNMFNYLEKANSSYEKSTDTLEYASFVISLGVSYSDLGQLEKANEVYIKAIKMAETAGDSLTLGYLYSNLAGICNSHTFKDMSEEYNLRSLEIFRDIRNEMGIAYVLNNLGQYYFDRKDYPLSEKYYLEAVSLMEKIKDWQRACFAYCNLSEVFLALGDPDSAKKELEKADEMATLSGDGLSRTVVWFSYGNYYSVQKEPAEARKYYQQSLDIAEKMNLYEYVSRNLAGISEQFQAEGRPEEALAFYKRYTFAKDSVTNANNIRDMAELQLKFETQKKDDLPEQISLLWRNNIIRTVILCIILLFILAGSILVYRRIRFSRIKDEPVVLLSSDRTTTGITRFPENQSELTITDHLTPDLREQIWLDLNILMVEERVYLNSDLKLSDLAEKLNTNTSYLSKVINNVTGDNFCNYLNQFRIREAERLLSDPANHHYTIEAIAKSVGFNSKSVFNRSFKKYKSITPSEFLNSRISRN